MHPSTNAATKRIQGLLRIAGGWWPRWLAAPMAGGPGGLIQKQYSNQSLNQWTNQSEIESMRSLNDSDNHNPHVIPHLAVGLWGRWATWIHECPDPCQLSHWFCFIDPLITWIIDSMEHRLMFIEAQVHWFGQLSDWRVAPLFHWCVEPWIHWDSAPLLPNHPLVIVSLAVFHWPIHWLIASLNRGFIGSLLPCFRIIHWLSCPWLCSIHTLIRGHWPMASDSLTDWYPDPGHGATNSFSSVH